MLKTSCAKTPVRELHLLAPLPITRSPEGSCCSQGKGASDAEEKRKAGFLHPQLLYCPQERKERACQLSSSLLSENSIIKLSECPVSFLDISWDLPITTRLEVKCKELRSPRYVSGCAVLAKLATRLLWQPGYVVHPAWWVLAAVKHPLL